MVKEKGKWSWSRMKGTVNKNECGKDLMMVND